LRLNNKSNNRKINFLITGLILFLIIGIAFIFIRHRLVLQKNAPPLPLPPEKTEANLTIKKFHHVATEDGIKKWSLEAASASLYSQKNTVRLKDISVVFFRHGNSDITLTADGGELNSLTNDMSLDGNIVAVMPPYKITTENLNYEHELRIIHMNKPVKITGPSMLLQADKMTYSIETEIINCDGNVKGNLLGNIQ
jgi:LPS export ABC transporter protein LptC